MQYDARMDDKYEQPTKQLLILKGNSCIEFVSLPGLQSNFTNLTFQNREYGTFQITHFDFPLNDSLTKTFQSSTLTVHVKVEIESFDDNWITTLNLSPNPHITTDEFDIEFNLKRVHSSVDVANNIQIALAQLYPHTSENKYHWKQWISAISYEGDAQKLAVILTPPTDIDTLDSDTSIQRLTFTLYGEHTGRQGELAASIFGGTINDDGSGWKSDFDSGRTLWFYTSTLGTDIQKMYTPIPSDWYIFSSRPTRMFVDAYVYVHGAPEQSVWAPDGTVSDIMTVQPRNRPPGILTSPQAYLANQTHQTRTSLASIRAMKLTFTDQQGRVILLDEDYVVKIGIEFQS